MSLPRLVLGIDPGTNVCGFCLLKTGEPEPRKIGALEFKGGAYFRLAWLGESIAKMVDDIVEASDERLTVVFESVYFSRNVQALVMLARAQGAIIAAIGNRDIKIEEFQASKIKKAITGDGHAKKPVVAAALQRLLKIPKDLPLDATDAAGLAYFVAHRGDLFAAQEEA